MFNNQKNRLEALLEKTQEDYATIKQLEECVTDTAHHLFFEQAEHVKLCATTGNEKMLDALKEALTNSNDYHLKQLVNAETVLSDNLRIQQLQHHLLDMNNYILKAQTLQDLAAIYDSERIAKSLSELAVERG